MLTLLTGENSFEIEQRLAELVADFDGAPEKFDGAELEMNQLPDLLMGVSLFSEKRLVIIRGLAANKTVWDALPEWIDRTSDDINLILIEPKADKRTKTYKQLQKTAKIQEFKPWTERDTMRAETWLKEQAKKRQVAIDAKLAKQIVARVGVNQWQLHQALEKLSVLDEIDEEVVREVIEAQPSENVFELLETALRGDVDGVQQAVATLSFSEDPYRLFGLLSGQVFQLAALANARPGDNVAHDLGVRPFAISRLKPYAKRSRAEHAVAVFVATDEATKTTSIDHWTAIEHALIQIALGK